jgi:hypothetical protein
MGGKDHHGAADAHHGHGHGHHHGPIFHRSIIHYGILKVALNFNKQK